LLFLAPQVAELKEKHSLMRKHSAGICDHLRESAVNKKVTGSQCEFAVKWI
jgi:hypothetical protein